MQQDKARYNHRHLRNRSLGPTTMRKAQNLVQFYRQIWLHQKPTRETIIYIAKVVSFKIQRNKSLLGTTAGIALLQAQGDTFDWS